MAALLAGRLGVDPLWVRIGFVLLALAGGIGVLLYFGLWLALIVGRSGDRRWARYVGGAIVVFGIPLVLNGGSFEFMSGQVAVVLLLVGLMLALWQPRPGRPRSSPARHRPPRRRTDSELPRQPRERRPPSVLGRATLGVAIAVAAVGALIDEANGGRLHPEQWLGAAAVVCGLGLLVGAVRGYARWLVVPAVAFAGVGYASGLTAELGIDASHLAGDEWVNISAATPGGLRHEHLAFGTLHIDITGAPDDPVTIDARVAIGTIRVATVEDVTVEVRADIDRGSVEVNGVDRDEPVIEVGPEGRPDVIVDARVGRGAIELERYRRLRASELPEPPEPPELPELPEDRTIDDVGPVTPVADFVAATADGWLVLADGSAVIDASDRVVLGQSFRRGDGVVAIPTPVGEFQLLPRSLLITPDGEILDLRAIRAELAPAPTTAPETTAPPGPTTAPDGSASTTPPTTTPPTTSLPGG